MSLVSLMVHLRKVDGEIRVIGFAFDTGGNNPVAQFKPEHQIPSLHPAIEKAGHLNSVHFVNYNNARIRLTAIDALEYFDPIRRKFRFKKHNYDLYVPENFYEKYKKIINQISDIILKSVPFYTEDHQSSAHSFDAQSSATHSPGAPLFNAQSSGVQSGLISAPNLELNLDLIKSLNDQQQHLLSAALSGNGQAMNLQLNANLLRVIADLNNQQHPAVNPNNQQYSAINLNGNQNSVTDQNNNMLEKFPLPSLIDFASNDDLLLSHDIDLCHLENCPIIEKDTKPSPADLLLINDLPQQSNQTDHYPENSFELEDRFRKLLSRCDPESQFELNDKLQNQIDQLDQNKSSASSIGIASFSMPSFRRENRRRLSASGASVGSGQGWYDKYGNYNLDLNSTTMPEELGLIGGDLRKWFNDFRSLCASQILENLNGKIEVLNHRLFNEVYKYLPNDSCKLFWHEFVNGQGKGDFELFQDLFVKKFQLKFERDHFKNLISSNLPLATLVYEIKQIFKGLTGESALLLLFCTLDESKSSRQDTEIIKMMGNMKI